MSCQLATIQNVLVEVSIQSQSTGAKSKRGIDNHAQWCRLTCACYKVTRWLESDQKGKLQRQSTTKTADLPSAWLHLYLEIVVAGASGALRLVVHSSPRCHRTSVYGIVHVRNQRLPFAFNSVRVRSCSEILRFCSVACAIFLQP